MLECACKQARSTLRWQCPAPQKRPRALACTAGALAQTRRDLADVSVREVLTTEYDASSLEAFFARRPFLVFGRVAEITWRFLLLYLSAGLAGPARRQIPSKPLCDLLSSLGPTFVKLGQTLSTREDLVGKEIADALSGLQMSAPPFDDAAALDVIRSELGADPQRLYVAFEAKHVAAASLGQVYRARSAKTGDAVAVKVQRPDVLGSIALDVYVLRLSLGLVRRAARMNSDIRAIADEVGKGLFAELDYSVEADQAALFARAHSHLPYIDTVKIERALSSSRVLTSRWIEGASPTDLLSQCESLPSGSAARAALQARLVRMVNVGIECSLSQLLETGVMHADPHPGNLVLTHDDRLAYLDFGLLTFVPPQSSQAMMGCLIHVALGEWRAMADDLGEMGFLKDRVDRDALADSLCDEVTRVWPLAGSFGADSFLPDGSAQAGGALAARLADGSVRPELGLAQGLTFAKLAQAIIRLAVKYRFNLPPYYTLIVRSLCSLEGLALRVDPRFSIVNAAIPIILRRLLTDTRPAAVALLRELLLEDGRSLRVGMLEGLLRNYSVEVGKSMGQSTGEGVVLKGLSVVTAPERHTNGADASTARGQAVLPPPHGSNANNEASLASSCSARSEARTGAAALRPMERAARSDLVSDSASVNADSRTTAGHNPSPGGCHEARASNGATPVQQQTSLDVASSGSGAPSEAETSFPGQVLQMVLSARAAGVRRVLLEADMQAVVNQLSGPTGASMRDTASDELSKVLTWPLVVTGAFAAVRATLGAAVRALSRALTWPWRAVTGRRARARRRRGGGLHFQGVVLTPVALKRAKLVALTAFVRLWRQSRRAALASLWLAFGVVARSLVMPMRHDRPQLA